MSPTCAFGQRRLRWLPERASHKAQPPSEQGRRTQGPVEFAERVGGAGGPGRHVQRLLTDGKDARFGKDTATPFIRTSRSWRAVVGLFPPRRVSRCFFSDCLSSSLPQADIYLPSFVKTVINRTEPGELWVSRPFSSLTSAH